MEQQPIINLVIAIAAVLTMVLAWKKGYKKQVKIVLLALVAKAEQQWGSGTGTIKFSEVYSQLPTIITFLFTKKEISLMVDEALKELGKYINNIE